MVTAAEPRKAWYVKENAQVKLVTVHIVTDIYSMCSGVSKVDPATKVPVNNKLLFEVTDIEGVVKHTKEMLMNYTNNFEEFVESLTSDKSVV